MFQDSPLLLARPAEIAREEHDVHARFQDPALNLDFDLWYPRDSPASPVRSVAAGSGGSTAPRSGRWGKEGADWRATQRSCPIVRLRFELQGPV